MQSVAGPRCRVGGGHRTALRPASARVRKLLVGFGHLDRVIMLIAGCDADFAQEIIKLLAHVEVDLDRSLAPTTVNQGLGGCRTGRWRCFGLR